MSGLKREVILQSEVAKAPESTALARVAATDLAPNAPAELSEQPGKFRTLTKVSGGLFVASVAATAAGAGPFGVLGAALMFFPATLSFINDLMVPSPRRRESAKQALACFSKSLKLGAWNKAYACTHPRAGEHVHELPHLPSLDVMPEQAEPVRPRGVRRFWRSVLRSKGSTQRVCRKVWVSEPHLDGDRGSAKLILSVERFSAWTYLGLFMGLIPAVIIYMINRKTVSIECEVGLVKDKSQWWVVPGELYESQPLAQARLVGKR